MLFSSGRLQAIVVKRDFCSSVLETKTCSEINGVRTYKNLQWRSVNGIPEHLKWTKKVHYKVHGEHFRKIVDSLAGRFRKQIVYTDNFLLLFELFNSVPRSM